MRQIEGVWIRVGLEKLVYRRLFFDANTLKSIVAGLIKKENAPRMERHFPDIKNVNYILHAWNKGPANTFPAWPGNSSQYYQ